MITRGYPICASVANAFGGPFFLFLVLGTSAAGGVPLNGAQAGRIGGPSHPRLFFSPAATAAPAGEWAIGVRELFFPYAEGGIGGALSVAGSFSSIPGSDEQYYDCALKFSVPPAEYFDLATGVRLTGTGGGSGVVHVFGCATARTGTGTMTLGFGWIIRRNGFPGGPALSVGTSFPVGDGIEMITDNFFPWSWDSSILSAGFRFHGDPFCAETGFIIIHSVRTAALLPFPWVSVAYLP